MSHALLSPSASHRWIECPPSVRLTELMEDKPSAYADEGTLAHSIAEGKLKSHLGYAENPIKCEDALMDEYTDDYVAFVDEQMSVLENPSAFVEQRVDCSKYVPECFGTCDALIISDGVLHICDLKYGTGIKVEAVGNDQLSAYRVLLPKRTASEREIFPNTLPKNGRSSRLTTSVMLRSRWLFRTSCKSSLYPILCGKNMSSTNRLTTAELLSIWRS